MQKTVHRKHDAAAIVEWVLGVAVVPANRSASYDFDILGSETVGGALHVADAAPSEPSSYPLFCAAPTLQRSWVLTVVSDASVLGEHWKIRRLLAVLERAEAWEFGHAPGGASFAGDLAGGLAVDALNAVGVMAGLGVPTGEYPAVIRLTGPRVGGAAHVVNDVVEDRVWLDDGRKRMDRVAGCRHLFVWIDETDLAACWAIESDIPPEAPVRPPELTSLWVARRAAPGTGLLADRLWQTNDVGEWEALGPVSMNILLTPLSTA